MGFSCCEGFNRKINRKIREAIQKEHNIKLKLPRGMNYSSLAVFYNDKKDLIARDCDYIKNINVKFKTQKGEKIDFWIPFKCSCLTKKAPEKQEYKGREIFINKSWRGSTKYKIRNDYFKIFVTKKEGGSFASFQGENKEEILSTIKQRIDQNNLKGIYGGLI